MWLFSMISKTLCLEYKDIIRELCIPECSAFGVYVTCESCKRVKSKSEREWIFKQAIKAQQQIESAIGNIPMCPAEVCQEKVWLDDCPVKLDHFPIAYVGKRILIEERTLAICYQQLSDCGADLPFSLQVCTENNDYIGVIDIIGLPDDVDEITFRYPGFLCFSTNQILQQPECLEPIICDEEQFGVEAIWPKCHLIHPNCDTAKIKETSCFLEDVIVEFWTIDETLAIEIPQQCTCGACDTVSGCTSYTIEIDDPLMGGVCIIGDGCKCHTDNYVYVNYATAHDCGAVDENLNRAVALLTLLKAGKKKICDCGADESSDYIDWMLELDPSFTGGNANPFDSRKAFPYGKTRAGVEVSLIIQDVKDRLVEMGIALAKTGGFLGGMNFRKQLFRRPRKWHRTVNARTYRW